MSGPWMVAATLPVLWALLAPRADAQWRVWDMEERGPTEVHREVYRRVADCADTQNPSPPRWAQANRISDGRIDQPVVWDAETTRIILDRRVWRSPVWISFGVLAHLYAGQPVPVQVLARCLVTTVRTTNAGPARVGRCAT